MQISSFSVEKVNFLHVYLLDKHNKTIEYEIHNIFASYVLSQALFKGIKERQYMIFCRLKTSTVSYS